MTIFWIRVTENTLLKLLSLVLFIFFKLVTTELKITYVKKKKITYVILNSSTALDNNLKVMGQRGRREDCSYTKVVNI